MPAGRDGAAGVIHTTPVSVSVAATISAACGGTSLAANPMIAPAAGGVVFAARRAAFGFISPARLTGIDRARGQSPGSRPLKVFRDKPAGPSATSSVAY